ncbi:helix-turn-helix domain-containing protein [Pseudomonas sp. 2FE]|uniref:helix-turn-helix domain-containing protein n=1 Tax=Pseudomonas sp. 2FE TaxID=2502190 RepID=UPI0010F46F2B|nr:helix-turn-helix domain-containing protein [Pseudomonas sp. 2FE]
MKVQIDTADKLGLVIRASRKAMSIRQDDAAGSIGVSENFLGKVERGGETVQWGKLFQVMQELGLRLTVEVPDEVADQASANLAKYIGDSLPMKRKGNADERR